MLGVFVLGGLYLALRDEDATPATPDAPEAPQQPPKPLPVEGDDYRVEMVAQGEQNQIQLLQARYGVMYDDGSGGYTWQDSGYLRGNLADGFVRASASVGGTITFTINDRKYESVLVYSSEEAALKADEIPEDDGSGPQKQPEDDEDEGGRPTFPTRPPTGLPGFGGGMGSYFGGGY